MIKINLLPSYIADGRKKLVAWVASGVAWAVVVGACLFGWMNLTNQKNVLDTEVATLTGQETDYNAKVAAAKGVRDALGKWQVQPVVWDQLRAYNGQRPALYRRTANYIYRNAMALGMASTANQMTLNLYVTDIDALSRTFLYLNNDPDFLPGSVALGGVPVFRKPGQRRNNTFADDIPGSDFGPGGPGFGGLGAAGFGGGAGDMPGPGVPGGGGLMPPGFAGSGGSGGMGPMAAGAAGTGGGLMPPGFGGAAGSGAMGPMAAGPSAAGMMPPGMGSGGSGGGGMFPGAGGGGMGQQDSGGIPGIDPSQLPPGTQPLGAVVTFNCALKNQIVRPASVPASQGGGGMGMGGAFGPPSAGGGLMPGGMGMGGSGAMGPGAMMGGSGAMGSGGMQTAP